MQKYRGLIKIRFWYSEALGPRSHTAGVSLSLSSQDSYEFVNAAQWTIADYSHAVEKGIKEGLLETGFDPEMGIKITLDAIDEDHIDSSEHAFYIAAKCAAKSRASMLRS